MSIVWTTRVPRMVDTSSASKFGTVCEIFPRTVSPLDLKRQQGIITSDVFPAAGADDLLLVVGPMVMLANLAAMWAVKFGKVNYLTWNRPKNCYEVRWTQPQ